ncbi:MaoC family dehydratase [Kineosporia mesophila]|uniref:MaoC family dehydratase n=1 Tax=Kineosporia mesophila TaxID=566012 RepID=A0ABP7AJL4_9ACTN|nr:MaoC family dehydratase [Kineosporia mesophila]MCD5352469.1 MaoC family dehydratase [Kineosporia mesophila]
MRIFQGIDELVAAVGEHLGHSRWHTVSQHQIDGFAEVTGDSQWIHTDPQRAAQGPFQGPIAHGYLTLSLLPMLSWEVYRVDGVSMVINYGSNRIRFPSVVPVGSSVRAGIELLSVEPAASGVQVITRVTIGIEDAVKPACIAEIVSLLVP